MANQPSYKKLTAYEQRRTVIEVPLGTVHYENKPIQIYTENLYQKMKIFR